MSKRPTLSLALVTQIYERDESKCVYCGDAGYQIDHVVPVSRGGPTFSGNLVLACRKCNSTKGGRLPMTMIVRGFYWLLSHGESLDWLPENGKYNKNFVLEEIKKSKEKSKPKIGQISRRNLYILIHGPGFRIVTEKGKIKSMPDEWYHEMLSYDINA